MAETSAIEGFLDGVTLSVSNAVVPDAGEDSFIFATRAKGGFLCVADGCGGLGSRRYSSMEDKTGAFLAARLATQVAEKWIREEAILPETEAQGQAGCLSLGKRLTEAFRQFERQHPFEGSVRIVGKMQRAFPTTLLMALTAAEAERLEGLFLWAGDSRGYLLDDKGLCQMTADHSSTGTDALESLYREGPLTNFLSGDGAFFISARRISRPKPCLVVVATDGAFAYLPTPMEFEWLLLSSLHAARDMQGWQRRLKQAMEKVAGDDSTLLLTPYGYTSFEALKESLEPRRLALQKEFITPVRRRKQDIAYAQDKWKIYKQAYDQTEGEAKGESDWRI